MKGLVRHFSLLAALAIGSYAVPAQAQPGVTLAWDCYSSQTIQWDLSQGCNTEACLSGNGNFWVNITPGPSDWIAVDYLWTWAWNGVPGSGSGSWRYDTGIWGNPSIDVVCSLLCWTPESGSSSAISVPFNEAGLVTVKCVVTFWNPTTVTSTETIVSQDVYVNKPHGAFSAPVPGWPPGLGGYLGNTGTPSSVTVAAQQASGVDWKGNPIFCNYGALATGSYSDGNAMWVESMILPITGTWTPDTDYTAWDGTTLLQQIDWPTNYPGWAEANLGDTVATFGVAYKLCWYQWLRPNPASWPPFSAVEGGVRHKWVTLNFSVKKYAYDGGVMAAFFVTGSSGATPFGELDPEDVGL